MQPHLVSRTQFPERPSFSESGTLQAEVQGRVVRTIAVLLSGLIDGAAALTLQTSAAWRLLGSRFQVNANNRDVIDLDPIDMALVAELANGSPPSAIEPAASATDQPFLAGCELPLDAFVPRTMLDARMSKVFVRGQFGAATDYSPTNASNVRATLRMSAQTVEQTPPEGFLKPAWHSRRVALSAAEADRQERFQWDRQTHLGVLMIRTHRAALDATGLARVDGMLAGVRVDIQGPDGSGESHRYTYGELKEFTANFIGADQADIPTGCVLVPFRTHDPATDGVGNMVLDAGTSVNVHLDTASAKEDQFTEVTPQAGDEIILTWLNSEPVGQAQPARGVNSGFRRARR